MPLPKLEGYKETVWYTDGKFTTKVTLENIDTLQPVYTKGKLAASGFPPATFHVIILAISPISTGFLFTVTVTMR